MTKKHSIDHPADVATVLGVNTALSGTLRFESSLMVRGRFEGDIDAKGTLYIDEGAVVDAGRVRAMNIMVAGTVRGDLEAADRVELRSTAQVRGNVRTAKLRIADGVIFEGRCEMLRSGEEFDPFAARRGDGA